MVHTRQSFEALKTSPKSGEKVPEKVKKAVKIQVDESSEESGLETAPFSSKRRLRYNKGSHETSSKSKQSELCGVHNLRSSKSILADNTQPPVVREKNVPKSCTKSVEKGRERRRRISEEEEDLIEPSIRRSARQRRGVYDTLNINMLTDHRYVHSFDSFSIHEVKKLKKKQSQHSVEEDEFFEGNDHVNMYDHVKRRHETPTPEKRPREHGIEEGDGDDEGDEDIDGNESDDSQDDEEDDQQCQVNKYLLRKRRPVVNRYMAPPMSKKGEKKDYLAVRKKLLRNPPPHTSPLRRYQHKRKAINMSSSTSSDDSCMEDEEKRFERRKSKSTAKARMRALPVNLTIEDISKGILRDRDKIGSSLADVDPMSIDKKVQFDGVGGLEKQIKGLKEMILFPLMYPEVFSKFKINPPRGVLFYGPPGTGKTLVARALANECSLGNQKVAFFMRKGADCLSKWVGESERQLRLLFDQAYSMRPSIIFFDEIDGLAPVRSSRQDQIHSSIVSTLLALMDGLDSRGEVVVIGATNRIDAIDPALRRPGRFDREFQFPLPNKQARRHILSIHTRDWEPKPSQPFINELADYCVGYCGADIKALCTEAALSALRRCYPQVYTSNKKLLLDVNSIEVTYKDFFKATKAIVPAFQRSIASPARVLSENVKPLLQSLLDRALDLLANIFPKANTKTVLENSSTLTSAVGTRSDHHDNDDSSDDDDFDDFPSIYDLSSVNCPSSSSRSERYLRRMRRSDSINDSQWTGQRMFDFHEEFSRDPLAYRPRFLLAGEEGAGQTTHLAPAILHCVEHLTVYSLDLPALYGVTARTPEEACAQLFREARRSSPSVIYMPHINSLWYATTESLHATLLSLLQDLPPLCPVLLLATTDTQFRLLPSELQKLFSTQTNQVLYVGVPNAEERKVFFEKLFLEVTLQTTKVKKSRKRKSLQVLPLAPAPAPRQLSEAEIKKVQLVEENTLRELRIFLRDIHHKLIMDRRFKEFTKPVDLEEVPDYLDVVDEPMDLSIMMQKIDRHQYNTCAEYLLDVDLITSNALKYNPDIDPLDKIIRHRACELRDTAHSVITSQLEPEFEKACEEIITARQQRGEQPVCLPAYVHTLPKQSNKKVQEASTTEQTLSTPANDQQPAISVQENSSQPSTEFQVKRKRRKKSYWFGLKRRSSQKKKTLTDELEANKNESTKDGDDEEEDKEKCDDPDKDKEEPDENSQYHSDNPSTSVPSPPLASSSSEYLQNGDIDDSSNSSKDNNKVEDGENTEVVPTMALNPDDSAVPSDSCKSNREAENQEAELNGQEDNERDEQPEKQAASSNETPPRFNHLTATVNLSSLAVESLLTGNKNREEQEKAEYEPLETHSEETVNKWREELQTLLNQMVDMTQGCSVETLERYHNRLQLAVHHHRYNADKTELIKDFSNLMKSNFSLFT